MRESVHRVMVIVAASSVTSPVKGISNFLKPTGSSVSIKQYSGSSTDLIARVGHSMLLVSRLFPAMGIRLTLMKSASPPPASPA
jgi:hypothetical protein